jgi:hypothetical protein
MEAKIKISWKKVGRGSFRLNNRIIKPGEVFKAYPDEIPQAFRDSIIPLDDIGNLTPQQEPAKLIQPKDIKKVEYKIIPSGRKGYFDIESSTGKKMNEKPMREETAEKLIEDLSK